MKDAFSVLHTMAYSIIALQELNLNYRFNPLYWNTAVLSVNSASNDDGSDLDEGEDSKNKSTNYGKVASAIGMMKTHGVKIGLPDVNQASFGFKPDIKGNQIIFGLKGLVGIGDETVQSIVINRPYKSFDDFYDRMHVNGTIKKSQLIQLIKAGCFDSYGDRISIMKRFVENIYPKKDKLTLQNFNSLIEHKLIPEDKLKFEQLFLHRKQIMKNSIQLKDSKDKNYKLDSKTLDHFYENYSNDSIVDYQNNYPIISEKVFKKEYDKKMIDIKEWLSAEETLNSLNEKLFAAEWENCAGGSISKWEMDSLSFYYSEHELANVERERYGVTNFKELPEEPIVTELMKWKDRDIPKFKIDCIVGTVLDKNKNKNTVTLLTTDGVVAVKYADGQFAHYNKQISKTKSDGSKEILEKSWFTRGNKLVVVGYRRGSQFRTKRYKDTKYQHTTMLIDEVTPDGILKVTTERRKI